MILKSAMIRCYGVKENGEKISWEKILEGYCIDTLVKKARKYFEAFLIVNDISDTYYFYHHYDFGVYITSGIAYGSEPLNISVYGIRKDF